MHVKTSRWRPIPTPCATAAISRSSVLSAKSGNVSFDHTGGVPDEALSVSDSEVADDLPDHEDTTYTVVNNGSSRGRAKLVDSNGYSYTVKRT